MVSLAINDVSIRKEIEECLINNCIEVTGEYTKNCSLCVGFDMSDEQLISVLGDGVKLVVILKDQNDNNKLYGGIYYAVTKNSNETLIKLINEVENQEKELLSLISTSLLEVGISPNSKGYIYLKEIVFTMLSNFNIDVVIKNLYKELSAKHNTKEQNIERNIRYSIETAFNKCRLESFESLFGNSLSPQKGKPTNIEFIFRIVDNIKLKDKGKL